MMLFHHTNAPSATGKKNHSLNAALRRAFTITELVIVIAVIAILAAVLIPTFTSLVNRANESADIQTVKNLNTILSSNEAMGDRADTIDEALQQALDGGYKVENLTPTGDGYDIVWDATNNRFALVDGENKKVYGDALTPETISGQEYWKITDDYNKTSDNNFSWYLTEDAQLPIDSASGSLEVNSSMDLSAFPELESVTIPDNATGTINLTTNSEDVKVYLGTSTTANSATVNLYGTVGTVGTYDSNNAINTSFGDFGNDSLHVYGHVEKILMKSGRLVAHEGSSINQIGILAEHSDNFSDYFNIYLPTNISIEKVSGSTISSLFLAYTNLSFDLSDKNGTLESLITDKNNADGTETFIYDSYVEISRFMFPGKGIGTEDNPFLITSETQLSQMGTISPLNNSNTYFQLANDINVDMHGTSGISISKKGTILDLNSFSIIANNGANAISLFSIQNGGELTINGEGTIAAESENAVGILFTVGNNTNIVNDGSLTINGGSYIAKGVARADRGTIVINGGEFRYTEDYQGTSYLLNYLGKSFTEEVAEIKVYGGSFVNFDPSNAQTETTATSMVADGYQSTPTTVAGSEDIVYVVSKI